MTTQNEVPFYAATIHVDNRKVIEVYTNEIIDGDYHTIGCLSTNYKWLKSLGYTCEPVTILYGGKNMYWLQFDSPEISAWYAVGEDLDLIPFDLGILPELIATCPQYEEILAATN